MIDGHCHLDPRLGSVQTALAALRAEAQASGMRAMLLLNLPEQGYSNEEVLAQGATSAEFFLVFPGLNPLDQEASGSLRRLAAAGAVGIKLHPRLHGYAVDCPQCAALLRGAGELGLPVLLDCFPAGGNLALGNTPGAVARAAEAAPHTRICMAHAGGHHILDAMMVAKHYPNVHLDLSFTLLYYRTAQMRETIAYVFSSMKGRKLIFGTDYPDRGYAETVRLSLAETGSLGLDQEACERFFRANVQDFVGRSL